MFNKKIHKIENLFCASKYQFNLNKYWEICGKVPNCVVLCKTNMDKIIGGYTPLIHDQSPYDSYVEDLSGESIIFSLTDNEKFTLKNKNKAIYRYNSKSAINFGGGELYIKNESNQNHSCIAYVNNGNYNCSAYIAKDKSSYLKFHGN
jgi:hypothetical protein